MTAAPLLATTGAPSISAGTVVPALPSVPAPRLAAAYAACRRITRARARNFYYGLRLTPEPRRSAIYSIYAWMRGADDAADADPALPLAVQRRRLAEYRARTRRALEGDGHLHADDHTSFWLAFAATVASYRLDHTIFHDMLDGLAEDLDHPGYDTEADLARYCYRVASTAGLACVSIWGIRPAAPPGLVRDLAVRRGQAFQRTNILRDFAQDLDTAGRIYLPRDSFERHALTPADLRAWRDPARCRAFLAEHAAAARAEYDASASLETLIDPSCAPTLWAMTRIYRGLLDQIERDPSRVVSGQRIRLSSARKACIALRACMRAKIGAW